MIKSFMIYDSSTKKIKRVMRCTEEMISLQLSDGESYLEGDVSAHDYKVNDNCDGFDEYTDTEKTEVLYNERKHLIPMGLDIALSDTELNTIIEDFFLNQVRASTWRRENYKYLRSLAYPDYKDNYLDAVVKVSAGSSIQQSEGDSQLQQYYMDCLAVKKRFPKPTEE